MILRRTPFLDNTKDSDNNQYNKNDYITNLFINIIYSSKNGILLPNKLDRRTDGTTNARNLITQLLSGDKTKRIGNNNSPLSLLNHVYFHTDSMPINSEDLYNQIIPAPILQPIFTGEDIDYEEDNEYFGNQDIFKDFDK